MKIYELKMSKKKKKMDMKESERGVRIRKGKKPKEPMEVLIVHSENDGVILTSEHKLMHPDKMRNEDLAD